jgi:hypothetical protein
VVVLVVRLTDLQQQAVSAAPELGALVLLRECRP